MTPKEKLDEQIGKMVQGNFLVAIDNEGAHFRRSISFAHPGIPVFSIKNPKFKVELLELIEKYADETLQ